MVVHCCWAINGLKVILLHVLLTRILLCMMNDDADVINTATFSIRKATFFVRMLEGLFSIYFLFVM